MYHSGSLMRMWMQMRAIRRRRSEYGVTVIMITRRPAIILWREAGNMAFAAVPVDGSSSMADDLMESIEPFKLKDAVDFQTAYLSGYLADKYDVTSEETVQCAHERMKRRVRKKSLQTL